MTMEDDGNNIEWTVDDVIHSLVNDRHDNIEPRIPEGVIDLSYLLLQIRAFCARGRLLKSNSEYALGHLIGEFFCVLSRNANEACLQLAIVFSMLGREVRHADANMMFEEFLMQALSPYRFDTVMEELKVVPLVRDASGRLRPNFASLPIFFRPQAITLKMLRSFSRRQLRPTLPFLFPDESSTDNSDDSSKESTTGGFRVIDASEIVGDADPLDGFDECHEWFFGVEAPAYESGLELDELDELDPGENPDLEFDDDPDDPDDDTGLY